MQFAFWKYNPIGFTSQLYSFLEKRCLKFIW